ncbi:MAG: hypothetical protein CVV42_16760 [Candidatus Riflebacteria bacterium HGW-Riflebacteria-2]|jgi:hypothetical protein|nr:MAG: hypothetical protein CVV42_16760 [Candidatus Riflebacteria bacterium HGW-Riflebacteria-2]
MKFVRIALCIALIVTTVAVSAAAPSLNIVQKNIKAAGSLWVNDPVKAQSMLREAFAAAIAWTKDEYKPSVREQAFYNAITCFSPELVEEVALAADTYVTLFPRGRYLKKVNLYRAMAEYSRGNYESVAVALDAAARARGSVSYNEQTQAMSGYVLTGHHRSAERFIEGQRLQKPSTALRKDLRRFHSGNRMIDGLLKRVAAGQISGSKAADLLDSAIDTAYFAKRAPEAALTAIALKDTQAPYYNPVRTEWLSLNRVVKHATSPQMRLKKLTEFVTSFPEASSPELYKALLDLRYLYLLEFRDQTAAAEMLVQMKSLPGFEQLARIEDIVSSFNQRSLLSVEGQKALEELLSLSHLFPYDNGHLPVISLEYIHFLTMLADMIHGQNSKIRNVKVSGWNGLPAEILYQTAVGAKEKAYQSYLQIKDGLTPQVSRMVEDLMFPLYLPSIAKDRMFLAGLLAVPTLPDLGTDLLIDAISDQPRMRKAEHGFAVLSDVYNRHLAYSEAQAVWKILSDNYPDSVWLK